MIEWIEQIWTPHIESYPNSLLIMDQFSVHKLPIILNKLKELKTDILFIPPGLTSKLQPLDLYLNKPLKDRLHNKWEDYILNSKPNDKGKQNNFFIK